MRKFAFLVFISVLFFSCNSNPKEKKINDFAIIIHGGAGTILKKNMTD